MGDTSQAVGRRGGLRTKCFEEFRPLESLGGGRDRLSQAPPSPTDQGLRRPTPLPACVGARVRGALAGAPSGCAGSTGPSCEAGAVSGYSICSSHSSRVRTGVSGGFPDTIGGRARECRSGRGAVGAGNPWAFQALQTRCRTRSPWGSYPRLRAPCQAGAGHAAQRGR